LQEWVLHPSSREKGEDGRPDADARLGPAVAECINAVEGMEENKKHPYSSSAMSSNNFCTPEIEDWGNLKNDQI